MNNSGASLPTLQVDNINLHSHYNPELEAKKIVERQLTVKNPLAVIVIEPGLGYLIKIVKQKYPHCKIIALHICNGIKNRAKWSTDCVWEPQDEEINTYISHQLWQLAFPVICTIENPAARRINKKLYVAIKQAINYELHRLISNYTTIASFTKRWIVNCISNCLRMESRLYSLSSCTPNMGSPIIIIGSGPSLDNTILEVIARYRQHCNIWCLSSAMKILNYHNIIPHVLITTDGGHWASYHLHNVPKQTIIAMPLTAKIHHTVECNPVLFFNQQFMLEHKILNKIYDYSLLDTVARASVASSALELACLASSQDIVLTGIDFGYHKGKQTAHPHAFSSISDHDTWMLNNKESRNLLTFSESYPADKDIEYGSLRMSPKHKLYREELAGILMQYKSKKNIYQCMSVNPLNSVQQLNIQQLKTKIDEYKKITRNDLSNVLPSESLKQSTSYNKKSMKSIMDSVANDIIRTIESSTSLINPQPLKELCFGLAHKEYLQAYIETFDSNDIVFTKLKNAVISKLIQVTARYNR